MKNVSEIMFRWCLTYDAVYRKVKFFKICFSTGKSENSGFSENFGAGDLKLGRCRQLIQFMKYMNIQGQGHF